MQNTDGVFSNPLALSSPESVRSAYDLACQAYARKFVNELDHKPLDRELLQQFAAIVGTERPVLDLGCGPGHTTAQLTTLGLQATGVDLSSKMIEVASRLFPQSQFEVGNFLALRHKDSSVGGILAFYCIVHLVPEQLVPAFSEMYRVLRDDGVLLLSFHVGSEVIRAENFLDTTAVLNFSFFEPDQIEAALSSVGFNRINIRVRAPYDTEHPSRRGYVFAHKSTTTSITRSTD